MTPLKTDVISNLAGTNYFNISPIKYNLGKVITEVHTTSYTTTSTTYILLNTFTNQTGFSPNSLLELYIFIPTRNDTAGWSGEYFEPQVSLDNGSTWLSLGSDGYDGGTMFSNTAAIHYWDNQYLLNPGKITPYSFQLRMYWKVYAGTAGINDGNTHDMNVISGTAPLFTTNNNHAQHFYHYILKEYIPTTQI